MIEISRCPSSRAHDIMSFIDENWSKGHILSRDAEFMNWQHGDVEDKNQLNWLIATKDSNIVGLIGYIPFRIYSGKLKEGQRVVWVALWKVRAGADVGVGIRLLKAIEQFEPHDAIGVLGLNPAHPPMYRKLGFQTGQLQHYVGVHPDKNEIKLIEYPNNWVKPKLLNGEAKLMSFDVDLPAYSTHQDSAWLNQNIKNDQYFVNRYIKHPRYKYLVYRVVLDQKIYGTVVFRIATVGSDKALRIIDYSGNTDAFAGLGTAIALLLQETQSEYVDLWCHGFKPEVLEKLGMQEVQKCEGLIVPNYFEPFVSKNVKIEFALKGFENLNYLVMRGDGDQDRPC
jgi:hypothetical protein